MEGKASFPGRKNFAAEDLQMANNSWKPAGVPVVFRNVQIKTMMRHHFTPIKMTVT